MVNWIDINLPWRDDFYSEDGPKMPDLQEREREVFGISLKESEETNQHHFEAYSELLDKLRALQVEVGFDFSPGSECNRIEEEFWSEHGRDECVLIKKMHLVLEEKIIPWSNEQPEWKAYSKAVDEYSAKQKLNSFTGRGLNKPGTIIEMADGSIELIGTINDIAGICNDCVRFEREEVVVRYAVVYPFTRKKANEQEDSTSVED